MAVTCRTCGATVSGRFCGNCGTPAGPAACPGCGAAGTPGARFCASCGRALTTGAAPPPPGGGSTRPVLPLVVGAVAVLAVVLVFVLRAEPGDAPVPVGQAPFATGGGAPPDLSTMTPRQQFDRLYERIMMASERGDTLEAARFAPMALMAYRNLPPADLDADARFHAAMIRLHTGDAAGAGALGDSILALDARHLFGFIVQNGVGRFQGDPAVVDRSYREFLAALDRELAAGRWEYEMHQSMIDNFQQTARRAVGGQ